VNINTQCGSTHLKGLCGLVKDGGYDLGVAFDGDADRCLIVDEKGGAVDGDHIMAVCGLRMKKEGRLKNDTIVATVMSNLGFHAYARENGMRLAAAAIGDRNVLEEMLRGGYALGGEQSGHVIFLEYATTGDGQITALQFMRVLLSGEGKVSELMADIPQYPQVLLNVKVKTGRKEQDIRISCY
jgi:phosphoglucosamine mutase